MTKRGTFEVTENGIEISNIEKFKNIAKEGQYSQLFQRLSYTLLFLNNDNTKHLQGNQVIM